MAVNQNIYGDKASWGKYNSNSKVRFPNFGNNLTSIKDGYDNNKLPLNTKLNNSIVHSALGSESALSHMHWYLDKEEFATDDFEATQFCFAFGYSSIAYNYTGFQKTSQIKASPLLMTAPVTNKTNLISTPVIDFDYKTLRAVIMVTAQQTDKVGATKITVSLKEYITTYTESHPYIRQVHLNLYEKQGDSFYLLNNQSQCGIMIFNNMSLYKPFKRDASTTWSKAQTGTLFGNIVPTQRTPKNSSIIILGVTSSYYGASATNDRIDSRYVNSFTDGVEIHTVQPDPAFYIYETYCYRVYDSGFEEYIKRQTACFGIQFVLSPDDINIDLEDESTSEEDANKVYIGILDDNFVGHGDYVQGSAILAQPQYALESADESPYTPSAEGEDDFGELGSLTHAFSGGGGGYTIYNLTENNMNLLMQWLNSTEAGETGQNYAQYLSSIKFSVFGMHTRGSEQTLRVAGELVNVGSTAVKGYTGYRVDVFTSGSFTFERYFNDFRDFEPYTQITLKLPFADTIKLNAGEWYEHTLSVRYAVDELTGTGSCMIYRDNLQYASVNCSMFIEVPVSALNSGTYNNALIQAKTSRNSALLGIGSTAVSLGASVSTSNAIGISASGVGLVGAIDRYKQAEYNLGHIPKSISHIGSAGDITDCFFEWRPNIIIERPQTLSYNKTAYADTVGYACLKTGTLSSFSGLTVCSEVKLSDFGATAEEKRMIKEALCKGVYL